MLNIKLGGFCLFLYEKVFYKNKKENKKIKKRLHDKKAGIAILISLIIISLAEIIFRAAALGLEAVLTTSNLGEQLAVIALAITILILTAKGKDRACYICYGAWAGYFILDQLFELPAMITTCLTLKPAVNIDILGNITLYLHTLSMIAIVAIGVLLVEYMTDGTIYNRAFNILCIVAVIVLLLTIGISAFVAIRDNIPTGFLIAFNNIYRITMVFLFAFFAYDSAKAQLKKTDLTK